MATLAKCLLCATTLFADNGGTSDVKQSSYKYRVKVSDAGVNEALQVRVPDVTQNARGCLTWAGIVTLLLQVKHNHSFSFTTTWQTYHRGTLWSVTCRCLVRSLRIVSATGEVHTLLLKWTRASVESYVYVLMRTSCSFCPLILSVTLGYLTSLIFSHATFNIGNDKIVWVISTFSMPSNIELEAIFISLFH